MDVEVTFDDLYINDDLPDLDRIEIYTSSNIALQRLVHIKMLGNAFEQYEFQLVKQKLLKVLNRS